MFSLWIVPCLSLGWPLMWLRSASVTAAVEEDRAAVVSSSNMKARRETFRGDFVPFIIIFVYFFSNSCLSIHLLKPSALNIAFSVGLSCPPMAVSGSEGLPADNKPDNQVLFFIYYFFIYCHSLLLPWQQLLWLVVCRKGLTLGCSELLNQRLGCKKKKFHF